MSHAEKVKANRNLTFILHKNAHFLCGPQLLTLSPCRWRLPITLGQFSGVCLAGEKKTQQNTIAAIKAQVCAELALVFLGILSSITA